MNIIDLMPTLDGFISLSGVSDDDIREAEDSLGLKFAKEYKDYLLSYGVARGANHELTGICNSSRLNVINVTVEERVNNPIIPNCYYVIERLNIDNAIVWQSPRGKIYLTVGQSKPKKIANSLVDYICKINCDADN